MIELECKVPLSQSLLWRLQSDFYSRRGLKAWSEDGVPGYITSNPLIAETYARLAVSFLADCMASPGWPAPCPERPLRILELGAGTGKFAYLFFRALLPLLQEMRVPPASVRYSLTDCSEDLLAAWRANPRLRECVDAGLMEFELVRAEENGEITPSAERQPGAASPAGPLVVIANYVFDSLPQDSFAVGGGTIEEFLVTSRTASTGGATPVRPVDLELTFSREAVPPRRYADEKWNAILECYRRQLPPATLFFPATALALLEQLSRRSDGRMLLLAADKGLAQEAALPLRQGPPELEFHASGQCFSTLVNFDAIARYLRSTGGDALLPEKQLSNLSICAFLRKPTDLELPLTRKAYREAMAAFGPDDLFTVMDWLDSRFDGLSVPQALSLLRLTRWDPTALLRLFSALAPRLREAGAYRHDLRSAILKVWANDFPVTRDDLALAFTCGAALLELGFFHDALEMFSSSEKAFGASAPTSYNQGLCYSALGEARQALACMERACELDPSFAPARGVREKLQRELQRS